MSKEIHTVRDTPVTLIHHAANGSHQYPPGSIAALVECLSSGAKFIEIDIIPLADGSFALLHDQHLAAATSGKGLASQMSRSQVSSLRYKVDGRISDEPVGFLEDAIDLLRLHPRTLRLQLDLKPFSLLTESTIQNLLQIINPVLDRIQVTSVADWVLRLLAAHAPRLLLGFDPLLYLDIVEEKPRPENIPPFRVGAYGLLDDHPLSAYQWGPPAEYFAARAEALAAQAPGGCEWFIRAEVLQIALDAGFNWIDFLHQQGSKVDAWTIDADQPSRIQLTQRLIEHGIDALTTNTPAALAQRLNTEIEF